MPARDISVKLVIASEDGGQFLLHAEGSMIDCPKVILQPGSADGRRLPEWIEAAMRQQLGLNASCTALLQFQTTTSSYELIAVAALKSPAAVSRPSDRFRMLPPHELRSLGLPNDLIIYFDHARELHRAERQTAERHVTEQHAADLGVPIQRARDRALAFLGQHIAVERGYQGWSPFFDSQAIGLLSTAQGLLAYVHAGQRGRIVDDAASTIESMQNRDGGWQVRQALVGHQSPVSITESTCYCLWALLEAGRMLENPTVQRGLDWLERAQQRPGGGWGPTPGEGEAQVCTTAMAVRILARCDRPAAVEHGAAWLRQAQRRDGGWGLTGSSRSSSPACTAHSLLALLANGAMPDEPVVRRGCKYLCESFHPEQDEPWEPITANTVVDDQRPSRLEFRHFATPWALAALSSAGRDLTDPVILQGAHRLLELQETTGAWRCKLMAPGALALWAVHDALFAISAIVEANTSNLAPLVRNKYREYERRVLHEALGSLLNQQPLARTRRWLQTAWLAVLTGVVALLLAMQLGLFRVGYSGSALLKALTAGATALIAAIGAVVPAILVEEYKIRRGGQERRRSRRDRGI
jgi:hypothetical protein